MVNITPSSFNTQFESFYNLFDDFNNPFYISTNHWTTITPIDKITHSLEAMVNFATTNTRFYGNAAFSTTDGENYAQVGDFGGSALKSDIVYLDNAMWISTYSDPITTTLFSNDGLNFKFTNEIGLTPGPLGGAAEFHQAGSNIIAKDLSLIHI